MSEVACIEVGSETVVEDVIKKENFTTNMNYLGHTQSGIPVYINKRLKQGEIKTIMKNENKEFEKLVPGKYVAKCLQVYEKINETDKNKIIKVAELEVEGIKDPQYVTFFMNGYGEVQMEISKKNIDNIIRDFKLNVIEDLKDKKVSLVVKQNDKGYINYFIYAPQNFMNWDGDYQVNAEIFSKSEKQDDNCVIIGVKFKLNGNDYTDFIWYHLNNEWDKKYFDALNKKLSGEFIGKKVQLKVARVQSKQDSNKWFTNKKLICK